MFRPNFSFDDMIICFSLFFKYKNRSSSSSIATNKKKKKEATFFSQKPLLFFSKKLRHLYESIPLLCFLLLRSVYSFLHRRARALWYVSLLSDPLFELRFRVRITVCVYLYAEAIAINQYVFFLF